MFRSNLDQCEKIWFTYRLNVLENCLDRLKREENDEIDENLLSSSRCQIYHRKTPFHRPLRKTIEDFYRNHSSTNVCHQQLSSRTNYESDLINHCAKIVDRIGHTSPSTLSNSLKKVPLTNSGFILLRSIFFFVSFGMNLVPKKKQSTVKLHSSMSCVMGENPKNSKRTLEECRTLSNSSIVSTNSDVNSKRQKRIGIDFIQLILD